MKCLQPKKLILCSQMELNWNCFQLSQSTINFQFLTAAESIPPSNSTNNFLKNGNFNLLRETGRIRWCGPLSSCRTRWASSKSCCWSGWEADRRISTAITSCAARADRRLNLSNHRHHHRHHHQRRQQRRSAIDCWWLSSGGGLLFFVTPAVADFSCRAPIIHQVTPQLQLISLI